MIKEWESCWRVGWSAVEGTKALDYEKRKSELSLVGLQFLIIVTAFFVLLRNLRCSHYKISLSLFIKKIKIIINAQLSHMAHFLWSATCHWIGHFCHLSMSCNIMYILVIVCVTKKPCGNENGHLRTALSSLFNS